MFRNCTSNVLSSLASRYALVGNMDGGKIDLQTIPFELTKTDVENLMAGDDRFIPHSWQDLKNIIGSSYLSVPVICHNLMCWPLQLTTTYQF